MDFLEALVNVIVDLIVGFIEAIIHIF